MILKGYQRPQFASGLALLLHWDFCYKAVPMFIWFHVGIWFCQWVPAHSHPANRCGMAWLRASSGTVVVKLSPEPYKMNRRAKRYFWRRSQATLRLETRLADLKSEDRSSDALSFSHLSDARCGPSLGHGWEDSIWILCWPSIPTFCIHQLIQDVVLSASFVVRDLPKASSLSRKLGKSVYI